MIYVRQRDAKHTIIGCIQLISVAIFGGVGAEMMAKDIIRGLVGEPNFVLVLAAVLLVVCTVFLVRGMTHLVLGVLSEGI